MDGNEEIIDSQIVCENVQFLDCFDSSCLLQETIHIIKDYVAQENLNQSGRKTEIAKRTFRASKLEKLENSFNSSAVNKSSDISTPKKLSSWGLPVEISKKYQERGIVEMFDWQVKCLSNSKVLLDNCNLVYSAPTSAGKTLVAEILTIKTILERQKKVIIILPFVSIVREKMFYLQDILSSSGIRVEGFMGSQSPPGGLQSVHVAICTIEKANSLVNKLIDDGSITELGTVVVDEMHLLGDPHRGYILELFLTKIKYVSSKLNNSHIQIVGMSATLPNLDVLAKWLDAELYVTQFRPIPLEEYCLVGKKLYDQQLKEAKKMEDTDLAFMGADEIFNICFSTLKEGCSVLIFCMTKNRCESLAQSIAMSLYKLGCSGKPAGIVIREQLDSEKIMEVLQQLENCPVGLDGILKKTISFGVAYHHAGLTFDERDIIEGAFKSGALRVLVATSTLSSGVNLPARKVIIRSPVFQRQPINILTYKQMIGRAGRMGKDTKGESILICSESEKQIGFNLITAPLEPVKSCIDNEDKFMRAILEMIASEEACTINELKIYAECTLLFKQEKISMSQKSLLQQTLAELVNYELIKLQNNDFESKYTATSLGKACLSSSMAPNDGLSLFIELQRARQCLVLENDLHLIYLVTPYSVSSQWGDIDWLHLLTIWESLTKSMKKVGELIGIEESFIIRCVRGTNKSTNTQNKLNVHKRFYTALALQDLINEVPTTEVAAKFQCARGFLQSLQQSAATFAGMVTIFCRQLGWKSMELLITQFQDRLHFGVHSELVELMRLQSLNGLRARSLFNAGFETIVSIASADINAIENALIKAVPFESDKQRDGDDNCDIRKRNKMKNIWITGCCGMTAREAADNLIRQARLYLQHEIGVNTIDWDKNKTSQEHSPCGNSSLASNQTEESQNCFADNNSEQKRTSNVEDEDSKKDCLLSQISNINVEVQKEPKLRNQQTSTQHKASISNNSNVELVPADIYHESISDDYTNRKMCNQKDDSIWDSLNLSDINVNETQRKGSPLTLKHHHTNSVFLKPNAIITDNSKDNSKGKVENASGIYQWESMNFSEIQIPSLSKIKDSPKIFSPEISFSDSDILEEHDHKTSSKSSSGVKDLSLFSSEEDNTSLFEQSLQLDQFSKITDREQSNASNTNASNAFDQSLDAFQSNLIIEDDEDIKLVYDEDSYSDNIFGSESDTETNKNANNKVDCKSTPLKKRILDCGNIAEPVNKRIKTENRREVKDNFAKLMKSPRYILRPANSDTFIYYIVTNNDVFEFLDKSFESKSISIQFLLNQFKSPTPKDIIGAKIFRKKTENVCVDKKKELFKFKGIALHLGPAWTFFLDFNSVANISLLKTKLSYWIKSNCSKIKLISSKFIYVCLKDVFDINLSATFYDIAIAYWLIHNEEDAELNINVMLKKVCNLNMPNGIEKNSIEDACVKAWAIWNISRNQESQISNEYFTYKQVLDTELKISQLLAVSESKGIQVDKVLAAQLLADIHQTIEVLQKKAFKISGQRFNMNSSKSVAKILGIYKGKKVSTKKSILTAHDSPLATCIIYWRKLNAILTKTLYPLTEKAVIYGENDRVKPTYNTFTCTGRVTMHEPNLQNVPRTFSIPCDFLAEHPNITNTGDILEFNCRNIFRAGKNRIFVSADYCQLEMRILTHFCMDTVLLKIMKSDMDVFKSIAASWGGVPEDKVDDDLRQKAKQLCYGIIYGMGNKTLGTTLDVSEMEAAVFMDTFHKTYPAIKKFITQLIDEYHDKCFIETLMKRRRHIPDLKHRTNASIRQAVNSTIQGSAADIVKAAMCEIDNRMSQTYKQSDRPVLVLQMHDELVYEVPEMFKDSFVRMMKDVMENTIVLNVPLPVKVKSGYTWGALTELRA